MAAPLLASLYDREPMTAEGAKAEIHRRARVEARKYDTEWTVTPKQLGMMNHLLMAALGEDDLRHRFLEQVFGNPSSKGLTIAQASAVIDWLKDPDGPGPHPAAVAECWAIMARARAIDDDIEGRMLDELWDGCQPDCMP